MVTKTIKKILPNYMKHPMLATYYWYWRQRGLPAQSRRDLTIFKEILLSAANPELRVFEWGSGASTVYYSEFLRASGRKFDWYAADNSPEWCQRCQEKIDKASLTEQVHVSCSEFPAFWEHPGYSYENPVPPQQSLDDAMVAQYVETPKQIGGQFDVIIIDGRFRRRCLEVAAQVIAPDGIVILHDAQKTHYHPSLELYQQVKFLETGRLPGLRQNSTIAMASLKEVGLITELVERYGSLASNCGTR